MEEKKDALQKLFFELPDTMSLEELMEVKGGDIPPIKCDATGSGLCTAVGSGICPNGGA